MAFIPNQNLELLYINGILWLVNEPFTYIIDDTTEVNVPKSFITDMASVPQVFWSILPPQGGNYGKAAIIHDYLYHYARVFNYKTQQFQQINRAQADNILYQAMSDLNIPWYTKYTIYYGVKIGGLQSWNNWRAYMSSPNHSDSPNQWIETKLGINLKSLYISRFIS